MTTGTRSKSDHFTVARFDGATGRRRFSRTVGRQANGIAIVTDGDGNPIAAGDAALGRQLITFTVAKLCRKNGRPKNTQSCPL